MFLLFSLSFSSLNLKYLKMTKMELTRFATKLFISIYFIEANDTSNSWEHCGVVVRALDSYSEGRGFESHTVRMPLDKAFCPQLSLSTQV